MRRSRDRTLSEPPVGQPASPATDVQATDLALFRLVANRDESALATLYDRYAAQVNGLALSILRNPALSEEATHDVFLRVWEQPAAYDPARGTFAGWLLRVTRNRAIDLLRRRREASIGDPGLDPVGWIPDPAPDPEEQTIRKLRRQEVRLALEGLPADQRRLLEMAYDSGLSQREIAERLGRPLGTVKSQIRSAMHRLADRLVADEASSPTEST
jgi:RNA polymerase sigma-70 factor (ECF subfamily)